MVSLETVQAASRSTTEPPSSPRISFSADFLDERNFISITPNTPSESNHHDQKHPSEKVIRNAEFEFLQSSLSSDSMLTADELFFEGKLLPFWHCDQKNINKISIKMKEEEEDEENIRKEAEPKRIWFVDEDPSPRPPKCTVLWKELLRLKKQRASTLSPSSSSSSSSSSRSVVGMQNPNQEGSGNRDQKQGKRVKKGLERTRSGNIRIRPMINVPICTQVKPPLFPLKKGKLER